MSTSSKGNYFRQKTKAWLESQGYVVGVLEVQKRLFLPAKGGHPDRIIFSKKDLWGADLIARNTEHLVFIQVKANAGDIARGIKELSQGPWPSGVKRWVAHWPPRRRTAEGPDITEVS